MTLGCPVRFKVGGKSWAHSGAYFDAKIHCRSIWKGACGGDGGQAFTLGFRAGQTPREELSSPLPLSKGPMAGALGETWKRRAEGHCIQSYSHGSIICNWADHPLPNCRCIENLARAGLWWGQWEPGGNVGCCFSEPAPNLKPSQFSWSQILMKEMELLIMLHVSTVRVLLIVFQPVLVK